MDRAGSLLRVTILGLTINAIALGLRIFVRIRHPKAFGYDDIALCIAFIAYIIFSAFTFIYLDYGYGSPIGYSLHERQMSQKFYLLCQLAGVLAAPLVKTSVVIVLLRINARRLFRFILLITLVAFWTISSLFFIFLILQCRPLSLVWGIGEGTCLSIFYEVCAFVAFSILDILCNWLYSLIPIAILWHVQMSIHTKVSVALLLGIGIISSIATVIRLVIIATTPFSRNAIDPDLAMNESELSTILWSHVEYFLALLTSSLAALRPMLNRVSKSNWGIRERQPTWNCQPTVERELSIIGHGRDPGYIPTTTESESVIGSGTQSQERFLRD